MLLSPRFWQAVEQRCPGWHQQREVLRADGRRLKARLRALLAG